MNYGMSSLVFVGGREPILEEIIVALFYDSMKRGTAKGLNAREK